MSCVNVNQGPKHHLYSFSQFFLYVELYHHVYRNKFHLLDILDSLNDKTLWDVLTLTIYYLKLSTLVQNNEIYKIKSNSPNYM